MSEEVNKKERNATIDLAKFIMAIFVLAIHVRPFSGGMAFFLNDCITRVANLVFFAISSYFFFYGLERERIQIGAAKWKPKKMISYFQRIFRLYTVWFVLNLPNFIWQLTFDGMSIFPARLLQVYFLSGPFNTALWFLPALLWGVFLTYIISGIKRPWVALLIGFLFHLLAILNEDYKVIVENIAWIHQLIQWFESVFLWLANGINYGLFYSALGACTAVLNVKRSEKLQERQKQYKLVFGVGTGVSLILYILECVMIKQMQFGDGFGAQFTMIPFTYFLLQFLLQVKIKERYIYRFLQKMSIVIFGVQFLVIYCLRYVFEDCGWYTESTTIQFICVLIVTCAVAAAVVWLSEHKRLRFLKYLY